MKVPFISTAVAALLLVPSPAWAYTVQPNDSLWKIAQAHHVSVTRLMDANHLTSTWIYPGQSIAIPDESDSTTHTYTVVKGDSLWKISQRYHTTVEALMAANHLIGDLIYPGQILLIPSGTTGSTSVHTGESVPAPPAFRDGVFPLPKGSYPPYSDNFGDTRTWNPNGSGTRFHEGVDIFAKLGTPIYAAEGGTIIDQGWNEYGGWRLTIRVDNSTAFYYAHLSGYADGIAEGATVKKGQLIGYVGNTGYGPVGTKGKFEPHLHFGIYKTDGTWRAIDPYPYLKWWETHR